MKLKQWRKKNKLTAVWLAKRLGCSPATISRYESGERIPGPLMMAKIRRQCPGVTADDFYPKRFPKRAENRGGEDEAPASAVG